MKRQLTLAQYRSVDLTLFAVILAVCEYVITLAAIRWFPGQLYTVSLTAALPYLAGGLLGGWIGGKLYGKVPVKWLKWLFAAFLFYAGAKYLL